MQRKIIKEWTLAELVETLNTVRFTQLTRRDLDLPVPLAQETGFFYDDGEKLYYATSEEDPEEWDDDGWVH